MSDRYITRYVNLTNFHHKTIVENVERLKLGAAGFSSSLREILREVDMLRNFLNSNFSNSNSEIKNTAKAILNNLAHQDLRSEENYIARLVNLEPFDNQIVLKFAYEKGYGESNYSAAVRLLIQHWSVLKPSISRFDREIHDQLKLGEHVAVNFVTQEDRFLEIDGVDNEIPMSDSEPINLHVPFIPKDEYEASLVYAHSMKRK